jgi:hypothetical protein
VRLVSSLLIATLIWLPCIHFLYARTPDARPLLKRQLALVDDPALGAREREPARRANPEWDLMGQTFVAWALANWALREPAHTDEALRAIDRTIEAILEMERTQGFRAYLLPYAHGPYQRERSLFVDSEILLTMALRRLVRPSDTRWLEESRRRGQQIAEGFRQSPLLESYPDEGWTFDHAVALAGLHALDKLEGTNRYADEIASVLQRLRAMRDPASGLLISSFRINGGVLDGPEGSTLWMTLHCLSLVDPDFAKQQYQIARAELGAVFLGFAWAREWPKSARGERDIDSGPVVPLLDVSAGSSGLAFVAASTFGDRNYLEQLTATLDFAAFPVDDARGRKYAAANQVGDAVLLYALELGPAWEKLR